MTFSSFLNQRWLLSALLLLIVLAALVGCDVTWDDTGTVGESRGSWAYPLNFGDSRAEAHGVLGNATRTTDTLEEYPLSGVTLGFSPEGGVTKFNFQGEAGAIYSGEVWIPSDMPVVFGLTPGSTDVDFIDRLGSAVWESEVRGAGPEVRRIWRRDGYVIDALFLGADQIYSGRTYSGGSLLWVEISPGL